MKEKSNVVRYRRPFQLNIGSVLCIIIFIYVLFHIFTFLTTESITIYEVTQGTIVSNDTYQGLAVRQETVVNTDRDGYPFYYSKNKSRVGVKSPIYSVDTSGELVKKLTEKEGTANTISKENLLSMKNEIATFVNDYDGIRFSKVYSFKGNTTDSLQQMYSQQMADSYSADIAAAASADLFYTYYAPVPGTLLFYTDGFEGLTVDSFTPDMFAPSKWNVTNLRAREAVAAGDVAYKMVTSDNWQLIVPIDESLAEQLTETTALQVEFCEDSAVTWAMCELRTIEEHPYLILSMDDSVDRYADSRYIDVKLLLHQKSGLKIPNSSIVSKSFFVVPKGYFMSGNDDSDTMGVLVYSAGGSNEFVETTIYYATEDCYYIDSENIHSGDQLMKANSSERYTVGNDVAELKGVYNVNKGYAVFKQIDLLYQNEDYSIINTGTQYGVSLYDHIVLQGNLVHENDIIYAR
ncbi:MAG: hypothetical protein K6G04_03955 [Lachnospiraceae bacterium]|nr:hypothetical protein [Lachnospiraceae bacterium]